ncbi:DUF4397 domain-containing protein [Algoriphagus boritolerans]|uniref:DUF4397 domain-containing protein n=1 Tax=Algoriphagus boritolerans DSM 17298 = JCM 18970 TaxID=1120964 RepID=A0A1H5RY32_9BACT|nr:DUF4397 domain-containing protein [Algoriphagus boritolerans]SEF42527.1 protein of unknown function [Algoriphagus boritolerans DSM 17298 = JCM 18970]
MRFSSLSKSITRRGILMVSGLLAGSLLLSSCLDNLESPELPPAAYVTIFQGSTTAPAMDIFANQNRVNQTPLEYTQVLPYSAYFPGRRDFRFSAFNSASALLEKNFELKADSVYSVFVADATQGIDAILVKDIWEDPTEAKAQLRFVHLSRDTESVYLEASGSTTALGTGSTFKSVSGFEELPKGNVTLTVKSTKTDETLIQTGTLELKGNRVYTLVMRGLNSESTGDKKLDLQLVTNYIKY